MTVHEVEPESRAENIARRVRGLMGEQRTSRKAVGQILGLSHAAVSRRTTGEVEFSIGELEQLAAVFGVSEAYLYGFTNDRSPSQVAGASEVVHPLGLEPRTRCLEHSDALIIPFPARRSSEVAGSDRHLAVVLQLPVRRAP